MAGIEGLGGFQPNFTPGGGSNQMPTERQGSLRGETVQVGLADKAPLDSDSLEELSIGNSSKMEKKDIGKFKLDGGNRREAVEAIQKIQEYLEQQKLPDLDPQQLRQLIAQLRQQSQDGELDEDGLGRALRGFHEDISYQQAALTYVASELEASGDAPELLDRVYDKIVQNQRAFAPDIAAGLNITQTALEAQVPGKDAQALRDFYRDSVVKPERLSDTYKYVLEQTKGVKDRDFDQHITFMIKALGADKAMDDKASVDPVKLKLVHDNLYYLEFTRTLREQGSEMLGLIDRVHGPGARPPAH